MNESAPSACRVIASSSGGRLSSNIDNWSVDKIKRMGGDAVKVLAWYRPDASADVNARDTERRTALQYASRCGSKQPREILSSAGAI